MLIIDKPNLTNIIRSRIQTNNAIGINTDLIIALNTINETNNLNESITNEYTNKSSEDTRTREICKYLNNSALYLFGTTINREKYFNDTKITSNQTNFDGTGGTFTPDAINQTVISRNLNNTPIRPVSAVLTESINTRDIIQVPNVILTQDDIKRKRRDVNNDVDDNSDINMNITNDYDYIQNFNDDFELFQVYKSRRDDSGSMYINTIGKYVCVNGGKFR